MCPVLQQASNSKYDLTMAWERRWEKNDAMTLLTQARGIVQAASDPASEMDERQELVPAIQLLVASGELDDIHHLNKLLHRRLDLRKSTVDFARAAKRRISIRHFDRYVEATDSQLWSLAKDAQLPPESRSVAVTELAERQVEGVADYLVAELSAPGTPREWRDELLILLEHVRIPAAAQRATLAVVVFTHLVTLRLEARGETEHRAQLAFWAAIRRWSTLAPISAAPQLLPFFDEAVDTLHVVLHATCTLFSVQPPPEDEALAPLRHRLSGLARTMLDASWVRPADADKLPDHVALSLTAFLAAASVGATDIEELARRLAGLSDPWLSRMATEELSAIVAQWRKRADVLARPAFVRAELTLEELRRAKTGSKKAE